MSVSVSAAGAQAVPFHFNTCPVVAPCCAISNSLPLTPLPDKRAVVATTCEPQLSPPLPLLSAPGAQAEPLYFNTWPLVGAVADTATPCKPSTVGLGYVPLRSPPALVEVVTSSPASVSPVLVITFSPLMLMPAPAVYVVPSSLPSAKPAGMLARSDQSPLKSSAALVSQPEKETLDGSPVSESVVPVRVRSSTTVPVSPFTLLTLVLVQFRQFQVVPVPE